MIDSLKSHEIPGRVAIVAGEGGMPALQVETDWSTAEIYPHGAHVTAFRKKGEAPMLFMSQKSMFEPGKPIRGGVPVIYPWFGGREGLPAHGLARLTEWTLMETRATPDGAVHVHFRMPPDNGCEVDYHVTVAESLTLELVVRNGGVAEVSFETCLHTYFQVGSIDTIEVHGLLGGRYWDQLLGREFIEEEDSIRVTCETDRVYQDSTADVEIRDPSLGRIIRVRKSGSRSTVVWNPWIDKSIRMPDYGDDEYQWMICVESGNVGEQALVLPPGGETVLRVVLDSVAMGGCDAIDPPVANSPSID